jgi:hypothetical protein
MAPPPSGFRNPGRRRRPINLSHGAFKHLAAALGVAALLSASAHAATWTLTTADGAQQPGLTVNTWSPAEGLSATDASGKLARFPSRDLVSLARAGQPPAPDAAANRWKLALRNGDVLFGQPTGVSGQSLLFTTPELGAVAVPLKAAVSLTSPKADAAVTSVHNTAPDKDLLVFANNDRAQGVVAGVDEAKLQLATDGAEATTDVPLANVAAVFFGGAAAPRGIPPLSARLTFASGSVFTVPLDTAEKPFTWTLDKITLKDPGGQEHTVADDKIVSAEVIGGRVLFLTELDPASEEQVSFLPSKWPAQINKNAAGGPLRVDRATYPRGIGVHTQSTLVYDLDGSFDTLSFRVGLDDSAAPYGEAKAAVFLDGKPLWQSDTLKPGAPSAELRLPVAGGKRLELRALPTTRLDVLGRVDWLNIALKRK